MQHTFHQSHSQTYIELEQHTGLGVYGRISQRINDQLTAIMHVGCMTETMCGTNNHIMVAWHALQLSVSLPIVIVSSGNSSIPFASGCAVQRGRKIAMANDI